MHRVQIKSRRACLKPRAFVLKCVGLNMIDTRLNHSQEHLP